MPDILSDRAVIALTGPEAKSFLQGLVTNDVTKVVPGAPAYAALLSAQGKILFDFVLHLQDETLLIDCLATVRPALIKRLGLYKLRAKLEIAPRDDLAVVLDGPADPRHSALPPRSVQAVSGTPADAAYHARRLDLGIPEGEDFGFERIFALDAGLDELHGVAFDKGCYVGQELTARMKHRGTDRKRLVLVTTSDAVSLPALGTPIKAGKTDLGPIMASYGARGFALIRLDRLGETTVPLTTDGVAVAVRKQDWLDT
jgi:folate-binding protein YgfZ